MKKITFKFGSNMNSVAKDETMTKFNSIEELVDNAIDAGAKEVDIDINDSSIVIKSNETENNIDINNIEENLFTYTDGRLISEFKYDNGSGRYGVGFKAACVGLIPTMENGNIIVESRANNGNTVHASWDLIIDDTNTSKNDDGFIDDTKLDYLDDKYNFFVKIENSLKFTTKDLFELGLSMGIRYNEKISDDNVIIRLNGGKVKAIDRLYLKNKLISGGTSLPLEYKGRIVGRVVWVNLDSIYNLKSMEKDTILIGGYDKSSDCINKKSDVNCFKRAGFEVGCNGIIFTYPIDNNENVSIFKSLTGVEFQQAYSTFRARIMITDNEFANKFFIGAKNKCRPTINTDFIMNDIDCIDIKETLTSIPSKYLSKRSTSKVISSKKTNNANFEKYNKKFNDTSSFKIKFHDGEETTEAFVKDDNLVIINMNNKLFKGIKLNDTTYVIIKNIIGEVNSATIAYKHLEDFRKKVESL